MTRLRKMSVLDGYGARKLKVHLQTMLDPVQALLQINVPANLIMKFALRYHLILCTVETKFTVSQSRHHCTSLLTSEGVVIPAWLPEVCRGNAAGRDLGILTEICWTLRLLPFSFSM